MEIPKLMSGVQLLRHGGPEALVWNDQIPVRAPGAGEVLVKVTAAGVNNTDINTRIGWYSSDVTDSTEDVDPDAAIEAGGWSGALAFPLIQGGDLCGSIVAMGVGMEEGLVEGASGPEAPGLEIGMRVTCAINQPMPTPEAPTRFAALGSEYDGAFAEYCTLPADQLFDVSASPLSDVEIAAIPCAFGTAINLLERAGVTDGDKVLITGASGGVGLAAVQLSKLRGAEVTGIASTAKHEAVRTAGASEVICRGDTPVPQTFDATIDVVGGADWCQFIDALKPGGRYAVSGAIAGPIIEADLRTIYLNDITIYGCTYQPREVFAGLVELINSGAVKPLVSKTYPLREIAKAQEDFEAKVFAGKLVLVV